MFRRGCAQNPRGRSQGPVAPLRGREARRPTGGPRHIGARLRRQPQVTRVLHGDHDILGWGVKDDLGLLADAAVELAKRHGETHGIVGVFDIRLDP